jgi:hypothetical protein
MFPFTRPLSLTAAAALAVLIMPSAPAHAGEAAAGSDRATVIHVSDSGHCALLKRAIARRACLARLERGVRIDTAQNK